MKKNNLLQRLLGIYLFTVVEPDPEHIPTQQEILAEMEARGTGDDGEGDSSGGSPTTPETKAELDDYIAEFKSKMPEDYKLPEFIEKGVDKDGNKLTVKEKFDFLTSEIVKATQPKDPFISAYTNAQKERKGMEFLEQSTELISALKQDNKTFYRQWLIANKGKSDENPNGISVEEIDEYIDKFNTIDLEEKVIPLKQKYKQRLDAYFSKQSEQKEGLTQKQLEKINADNLKFIEPYVETVKKNELSIPFSSDLKESYLKEIPQLITKDSNFQNEVERYLNKDENMLKVLPYIWMAMKGQEAKVFTSIKESSKQNALDKLFPEDEPGGAAGSPKKVDVAKLLRPDYQ